MQTKRYWIHNAARGLTLAMVCCLIAPNFGPGATRVAHAQPVAPPITSEPQFGPERMFGDVMTTPPTLPAELVPATVHAADVATQVGDTYTWMQDSRADWEQGTLENLDSAAVSGTLQLAQRYFSTNETITPREELASGQESPDIAVDAAGNAYAVWVDYRNGNADIYFAYRPVGGEWGASVKVNDDTGVAIQSSPAMAIDDTGNVYAMWCDERDGDSNIYFAYRSVGGVWGVNTKINDDPGVAKQYTPDIAVGHSGHVYAAWYDLRNGNGDVYFAQRLTDGQWSINVKVNDDTGTAFQSSPAVAADESGNAYVVWRDGRLIDDAIYFAKRSIEGLWEANVKINDDTGGVFNQHDPDIAVDSQGNVNVVWVDYRNANADVYFAHFLAGGTWSANVKINDDNGTAFQFPPAITVDGDGNAYIVWMDSRGGGSNIYFAEHPVGGNWSANVKINDDTNAAHLYLYPAIAVDDNKTLYAAWTDQRKENYDIYFTTRSVDGQWGSNIQINDDYGAVQYDPTITINESGDTYAVWLDSRNEDSKRDVYFATRPAGGAWGSNILVNDVITAGQYYADLAVDHNGNAYAIWQDARNVWWRGDLYFAYRPSGGGWEANLRVDDGTNTSSLEQPAIAADGNGNAYAVWKDYRQGDADIYFAYRPSDGVWGTNSRVNDDIGTTSQYNPDIVADAAGNVYAVWADGRNGNADIYFAYRPSGSVWETNVRLNDDNGTADQSYPVIAVDNMGNLYAAWVDFRNGTGDIYFTSRPVGGEWGANVRVNDAVGAAPSAPSIAADSAGNVYVVWVESRNGKYGLYFACRSADGVWSANVSKVNDGIETTYPSSPAIAVDSNGKAYVVWEESRYYGATVIYFAYTLPAPEYFPQGQYTSPILDTGIIAAAWDTLTYSATLSAGTALTFETRSRMAGGAWSLWQATTDAIASPPGQYFQYRVAFTTSVTDTTPILDWVKVAYTSVGTPSAPRFVTPCGVTNQLTPTLTGSTAAGSLIQLYVDGAKVVTTTTGANGTFALQPGLGAGSHVVTATAANAQGAGPASAPLALTVNPALSYNPLTVRAGQWSKAGWLLSPPRDPQGCANPVGWQVWPRANEKFMVQVPVSYTTAAAVTVTVGTQTITLTEGTGKVFVGVFQPPLTAGAFTIIVTADGQTTTINGGPVLIDPDGFVYEASKTISDTIPGVQVTCYYSDTHSGQWLMWDAWNYDAQVNPQITLDDGYYSFYTLAGTYRVVAEKAGYPTYTSPDLVVVSTPVRHNIPLGASTVCTTPLTGVGIVGPLGVTNSLYIGTQYTFQSVITPANATPPITYTWTPTPGSGQGDSTATYRWTTPGPYTVTLTAENCGGPVTATRQITLYDQEQNAIYLPLVLRNF